MSIIIFVAAVVSFGAYTVYEKMTQDTEGPQIIMNAESVTVDVDAPEEAFLEGITAVDAKDGDVTDSLVVESMSNFLEKGRRTVTIAAFDSDNHVAKVNRDIVYREYHSPRFSISKQLRVPLNTLNILSGVSAEDVLDGNLTESIRAFSELPVKTDQPGEYLLELTVVNSAGDVSKLPVTIEVYDNRMDYGTPKIQLEEYLLYVKPDTAIEPWELISDIEMDGKYYKRNGDILCVDNGEEEPEFIITEEDVNITKNTDYGADNVYEIVYSIKNEKGEPGTARLIVAEEE